MSTLRLARIIVLAAMLAGIAQPSLAQKKTIAYTDPACAKHAENELIESRTFEGKLTGFVWGDYLHAEFVAKDGKPVSLFIQTSDVSCFLARHKGENLRVSYNRMCRYVAEGAGIYPVEEIIQISAEKTDLSTWRSREYDAARDGEACEKLEAQYTRQP